MHLYSLKNKYYLLFTLFGLLLFANTALAQLVLPNPLGVDNIVDLINNVATYIFGLMDALAVLVFVYAGILFLTSTGNEARLGQAKKALLYGAIGLAIGLAGTGLISLIKFIING